MRALQDLTEQEVVAHRIARALSIQHRVDDTLYQEAEALLGAEGVVDIASKHQV